MNTRLDPTQRFSDRVENYIRFRPRYPDTLLPLLQSELNLSPHHVIADIGCGPGQSSEPFLRNGNKVYGIEPNDPMRNAAERLLAEFPKFRAVKGTAEATTLPDQWLDFITAMQAFHWFDRENAKLEFRRILRQSGHVILIWNSRKKGATPFLDAYEQLLQQFATDYSLVRHENVDEGALRTFLGSTYTHHRLENQQIFDYTGLEGRLLSSSYIPREDHPNYQPMLRELRRIFDRFQQNNTVPFEYDTDVYWGTLS
ncbi:MAG TPA: class I SAM-dependent methyltransferase [Tepidisphaeraceae bacterium]|jgi:SAM-dependent methyltransferase|nr:class I SAM-dependent methyltransferase [Tepidisphaeraceae bacterium]